MDKPQDSVKCYDKALDLAPDFAEAWKGKGDALSNQGKFESAVKCYNKALELNPDNYETWANKGRALGVLKRYNKGLRCLKKALALNPDQEFRDEVNELIDILNYERKARKKR
jgi:tetratricopeptide (TPR) repeat protein